VRLSGLKKISPPLEKELGKRKKRRGKRQQPGGVLRLGALRSGNKQNRGTSEADGKRGKEIRKEKLVGEKGMRREVPGEKNGRKPELTALSCKEGPIRHEGIRKCENVDGEKAPRS